MLLGEVAVLPAGEVVGHLTHRLLRAARRRRGGWGQGGRRRNKVEIRPIDALFEVLGRGTYSSAQLD